MPCRVTEVRWRAGRQHARETTLLTSCAVTKNNSEWKATYAPRHYRETADIRQQQGENEEHITSNIALAGIIYRHTIIPGGEPRRVYVS